MKNHGVMSLDSAVVAPIRKGRYDETIQEGEKGGEEKTTLQMEMSYSQEEAARPNCFPNKLQPDVLVVPQKQSDNEDELLAVDLHSKGMGDV